MKSYKRCAEQCMREDEETLPPRWSGDKKICRSIKAKSLSTESQRGLLGSCRLHPLRGVSLLLHLSIPVFSSIRTTLPWSVTSRTVVYVSWSWSLSLRTTKYLSKH